MPCDRFGSPVAHKFIFVSHPLQVNWLATRVRYDSQTGQRTGHSHRRSETQSCAFSQGVG